jgi:nucleotide-binding universal stress UspA family protein
MAQVRHIVVGVDGSANAGHALDWAITLARPHGARITAVHALGLLDRLAHERVTTGDHREAITDEFCRVWCAALDGAGVETERLVLDGPPADVILATAADTGADLVVVGERGIGAGAAAELGSTSRRVLESSTVPVLVVPRPA